MNLKDLKRRLKTETPKQLFGDNPKIELRKLQAICHPDHNISNENEAQIVFNDLNKAFNSLYKKSIVIHSSISSYDVGNTPDIIGDISDLYVSNDTLIKIARKSSYKSLFQTESVILKSLRQYDNIFRLYLPEIIDEFDIKQKNRGVLRCHVFTYDPNFITGSFINNNIKNGIDGRSFGWMMNRMLELLAHIHSMGYIHGAITPDHIMFNKITHGGMIVDWIHTVPIGNKISTISSKWKNIYPEEVFKKTQVSPETDLYMLGQCGIILTNGGKTLPDKLNRFLKSLIIPQQRRRPDNALTLHKDLKNILFSLYGKPKFHPLNLN